MTPEISEINFIPIRPNKGHIGFVSFVYNNIFKFDSIAVYTRPNPQSSQSLYRLVYPISTKGYPILYPINKEVGDIVEKDVSSYIENVRN